MAGPPTPNIPVALDLNIITLPCTFHLRIEDKEVVYKLLEAFPATGVAAATCAGLAAFFLLYYRDVWRIVRNVIVGNDHDQDPAVNDINPGSLLVDITCKTEESLLTLGRRYGDGSLATDIENGLKSIGYDKPITVTAEKDGKPFALDKVHQALLQVEGGEVHGELHKERSEDHGELHEGSDVRDKDTQEHLKSGGKTMAALASSLTPQLDEEQENYLRMRVFLERAYDVLKDVLTRELQKAYPGDFDPSTGILHGVLNIPAVRKNFLRLSRRNVLNASQKQILYPAGAPSSTAKVNDLDVTLTVLLLRNITTLNPSAKWDRPLSTDLSTEADIGRVKTYHNKHMHSVARLPATTFQSDFEGLKTVLLRLSNIYTDQDYDRVLIQPIQSSGIPTACQLMSVNLPRKDSKFCGREDLFTDIQQGLENKIEVLLLTGMGGIGKTSIAVEMGHRMSEEGKDVLFLDMRQVENLDSVQLSLVQHYNPKMFLKDIYADYQNLFQKTLSEIKSATVVIFDNIDRLLSDEKRRGFLKLVQDMLKASKHMSFVCTSRESFDLTPVKVVEKHIPPLDDNSSMQLLLGVTSESQTKGGLEILNEIAACCGHCPFALKLLAFQIREHGSMHVLENIKKRGVGNTWEFEGMASCFEMSFEALSDREKDLFCRLYVFPVSFQFREVSSIFEVDEDECKDILERLTSKSVVNRVSNKVYDLHPLLKAFSESQASSDPDKKLKTETAYCKYFGDQAIALTNMPVSSFPKYVKKSRTIFNLLFAAELLLKQLSKYLLEQNPSSIATSTITMDMYMCIDIIKKIESIANVLRELHFIKEAQHLSKELANMLPSEVFKVLPNAKISASLTQNQNFEVFYTMGKYDVALMYGKEMLELCEKELGTKHTKTADLYNNIGVVLNGMGKYDDALTYHMKSLEIREELLGSKHTSTADSYNNVGVVLYNMGKYDDAVKYGMKSLAIREQLLGTKHIKTAEMYNNIGLVLQDMGRYDDALGYCMKGLEIRQELLGTMHTATADSYNNIGAVLHDMGKYDDALTCYRKSLKLHEQLLGTEDIKTAGLCNKIGAVLRDMGKYEDSLTYCKKGLEIHEKLLGTTHIKTADSYNNIGAVLLHMGKYDEALVYHKKSLEVRQEQFGTKYTKTADPYNNIGVVLYDMGKYEEALKYFKKTLEIRKELLGAQHVDTLKSSNNVGVVLCHMGKNDDALKYLRIF